MKWLLYLNQNNMSLYGKHAIANKEDMQCLLPSKACKLCVYYARLGYPRRQCSKCGIVLREATIKTIKLFVDRLEEIDFDLNPLYDNYKLNCKYLDASRSSNL